MLCMAIWKDYSSHSFLNPDLARRFAARLKHGGQLTSKSRFLAAPWVGMLETDAWTARAVLEVSGANAEDVEQLVIIELKQWDAVRRTGVDPFSWTPHG